MYSKFDGADNALECCRLLLNERVVLDRIVAGSGGRAIAEYCEQSSWFSPVKRYAVRAEAGRSSAFRQIKHLAPTPRALESPPFLPDFFETGLLEIIRCHDDPKFDTGVESKKPRFS